MWDVHFANFISSRHLHGMNDVHAFLISILELDQDLFVSCLITGSIMYK